MFWNKKKPVTEPKPVRIISEIENARLEKHGVWVKVEILVAPGVDWERYIFDDGGLGRAEAYQAIMRAAYNLRKDHE